MTLKRIAFAAKWIDTPDQVDGIKPKDNARQYNTGTTTVAWLNRQAKHKAEEKLWDLMRSNIESIRRLIAKVGEQPLNLRMVRLSSEILPVYTEPTWQYFYKQSDVIDYCERHFRTVGDLARALNVRLSFHPGQFTVLASDNPEIVNKSIEEFEYHADMIRWMGYGQRFQDFKCNVHIAGRLGPAGIRQAYTRLSIEARNCLTVENEENSWGLDDCLSLGDLIPTVLDIHHCWIKEGIYIQSTDDRVKRVIDSWRGVRPVIHYSISREDCLVDHCPNTLPDMSSLLAKGHKKQRLRAHSDFYWNHAANDWALTHSSYADIMCESKGKCLASFRLFDHAKKSAIIG